MAKSAKKKSQKECWFEAIVHIKASFNNTLITITDMDGAAICASSAGCVGFKGSRKSTPFAAQQAAQNCANVAMRNGVREVEIRVKRPRRWRESAIFRAARGGAAIASIEDVTPLPHNGLPDRRSVDVYRTPGRSEEID